MWQALRDTNVASTYFGVNDRFIEGGLITNDPTLDALAEIHKFNIANLAAVRKVLLVIIVLKQICFMPRVTSHHLLERVKLIS